MQLHQRDLESTSTRVIRRTGNRLPVVEIQMRSGRSDETWIDYALFDNPQSTSCMFTHIKTNSKYDVRVSAKNKIGYGWPSKILKASTNQAGKQIRSL